MDLFLVNFNGSLPFQILEINTSHDTWFLVFDVLPSMSLSSFNLCKNGKIDK